MKSRVCWSCGTLSHMTRVGEVITAVSNNDPRYPLMKVFGFFGCDNCSTPSVGLTLTNIYGNPHRDSYSNDLDEPSATVLWYPPKAIGREYPDVPEHIAGAASEAHSCQSVGSLRAAVLMARSVIEATAKDKGITSGRLVDKIDKMREQGLIREHIREAAHEVRYLGNDMAHGDFVDPVTAEDAELVLTLMAEVLAEVFESPAKVARAKEAREARRAGGQSAPDPAGPVAMPGTAMTGAG